MAKRLIEVSVMDKLFKFFLGAKSKGEESKWLSKLRQSDPELADIWGDWDKKMSALAYHNLQTDKKFAKDKGTSAQKFIDKYGVNKYD